MRGSRSPGPAGTLTTSGLSGAAQDRGHGDEEAFGWSWLKPNPELAQLPVDPHAAPPGVLPGEPEDEVSGIRMRPCRSLILTSPPPALPTMSLVLDARRAALRRQATASRPGSEEDGAVSSAACPLAGWGRGRVERCRYLVEPLFDRRSDLSARPAIPASPLQTTPSGSSATTSPDGQTCSPATTNHPPSAPPSG